jgi:hypothetical protein
MHACYDINFIERPTCMTCTNGCQLRHFGKAPDGGMRLRHPAFRQVRLPTVRPVAEAGHDIVAHGYGQDQIPAALTSWVATRGQVVDHFLTQTN